VVLGVTVSLLERERNMQSNLVSFNVPNFVTINLMAWAGVLFLILLYQFVMRHKGDNDAPANNSGGY
jgi:Na+/H+-dicarboxylate symporter